MRIGGRTFKMSTRVAVLAGVPLLALAAVGGSYAVNGSLAFLSGAEDCEPTPTPTPIASAEPGDGSGLSLSVSQSPRSLQPDGSVRWSFVVTNGSDEPVVLTFPSGQDGDVTLSRDGSVAYRWSEGQMFTQAIREVEIGPGDSHSFALSDSLDLEAGTYSLKAWVTSDPAPPAHTAQVQVGDPDASPTPTPSDESDEEQATPTPQPSTEPTSTPTPTPQGDS